MAKLKKEGTEIKIIRPPQYSTVVSIRLSSEIDTSEKAMEVIQKVLNGAKEIESWHYLPPSRRGEE